MAVAGYGLVAGPPARPRQSLPEPLGLRELRLGEHQQPADFVGGEPDGDDAIAVTAGLPLFVPAAWRRAPARGPLLAAYLSAHRTMINGSALCAALAVTERD